MEPKTDNRPPQWAIRCFRWYCRHEMREELEGDLLEMHQKRLDAGRSKLLLTLAFWWDVIRCCKPYAWGTYRSKGTSLALYSSYAKLAMRHAWKNKGPVAINIIGLGLALGVCITIYMMHAYNLEFDSFYKNTNQIFRVHSLRNQESGPLRYELIPMAMVSELQSALPEVQTSASYLVENTVIKSRDAYFNQTVGFASSDFLKMFDIPLTIGNKEIFGQPNQVWLTKPMVQKLFGFEEPIGQSLTIYLDDSKLDVTVAGVFEKVPLNSSFQFHMLVGLEDYLRISDIDPHDWESKFKVSHYIKMANASNTLVVNNKLQDFLPRQNDTNESWKVDRFDVVPFVDPVMSDHLMAGSHTNNRLRPEALIIFSVTVLLILFTACFNMANTSMAFMAKRLKEIGIRKTLGSANKQIFIQFLFEMMITTTLAFFVAFLSSNIIAESFWGLFGASFFLEDISIKAILICILLFLSLTTLLAGLLPALYAWRFNPVSILSKRTTLKGVNWLHRTLTVAQYSFSITVLIAGYTFAQNSEYLEGFSFGYDMRQLIAVPLSNSKYYTKFEDNIKQNANISGVAGAQHHIGSDGHRWPLEVNEVKAETKHYGVGSNYFDVMGIDLTNGRGFKPGSTADKNNALIVNEGFVQEYFAGADPIGRVVKLDGQRRTVIGVVRNLVHTLYADFQLRPIAYTLVLQEEFRHMIIKSSEQNTAQVEKAIQAIWANTIDQPYRGRLQEDLALGFAGRDSKNLKQIFLAMAGLGCFLCIVGIFSLASLNVAKRNKEISLRKVLGARITQLMVLINRSFTTVLLTSLVIGVLMGYWLSDTLLSVIYHYHTDVPIHLAVGAGLGVMIASVLMITAAVFKPAITNPAVGLREE